MEAAAGRIYAEAIFAISAAKDKVNEVNEKLITISHIFLDNDDLWKVLKSPVIDAVDKKKIIDELFVYEKSDPDIIHLLYLMIDKRRINAFIELARSFKKLAAGSEGIYSGEIVSAEPLPDDVVEHYEEQTSKLFRKKILLEPLVDPSLIAGFRIFADGKLIDESIKGELLELKERLL
jgi:F-type H+-transporting ATPase subunit delta